MTITVRLIQFLPHSDKIFCLSGHNTGTWRKDRRTDGRTNRIPDAL